MQMDNSLPVNIPIFDCHCELKYCANAVSNAHFSRNSDVNLSDMSCAAAREVSLTSSALMSASRSWKMGLMFDLSFTCDKMGLHHSQAL